MMRISIWRLAAALAVVGIAALLPAAAADEYLAYAVVEDRGEAPLPRELTDIDDKYLVQFRWGGYAGPQSRVAVLDVENESKTSSVKMSGPDGQTYEWSASYGNQVPVQQIQAMLQDVMYQTGRFRVLERGEIQEVLGEQDLGDSGRVAAPSAAKIGKVLGAEYLVKAAITHYEPEYKGQDVGLGGLTPGLLGGTRFGKKKSLVGMAFRLVDAETGEVTFSKQVAAVVGKTSFSLGALGWGSGGIGGGSFSSFAKVPIGQAIIACLNKGVFELVKEIGSKPAQGSVIKADAGKIFINLGEDKVEVGDVFEAIRKGEELIDPDTGISLGSTETKVGKVTVTQVLEKASIGTMSEGDASALQRGDKLVSTEPPAELLFAAEWDKPRRR